MSYKFQMYELEMLDQTRTDNYGHRQAIIKSYSWMAFQDKYMYYRQPWRVAYELSLSRVYINFDKFSTILLHVLRNFNIVVYLTNYSCLRPL